MPCNSAGDAPDFTASLAASPAEPFVLLTLGGVVPDNQVHAARLFYGPSFFVSRNRRTRLITKVDIDILGTDDNSSTIDGPGLTTKFFFETTYCEEVY